MKNLIYITIAVLAIALMFILFGKDLEKNNLENNLENDLSETTMDEIKITSTVFEHEGVIPSKYTCDGENINPLLEIEKVPAETKSLVLIMDDPDIPDFVKKSRGIDVFDHWVVFNISPRELIIEEGKEPEGIKGANSAGQNKYTGPCPPDKEHRYFFKVYALDTELTLKEGSTKSEVEQAMENHILAQGVLMGKYNRSNR